MISAQRLDTAVLEKVDEVFADIRTVLEGWTDRLESMIDGADLPMTASDLVRLIEADAKSILREHEGRLYGAGFCAAPSLVSSGNPLAWWQGRDMALLGASTFGGDHVDIDLRRLEWYRVPQATGHSHVAGPYVDYLCSNEITITSANPVIVAGDFLGVVCIDILVTELEEFLAEDLRSLGRDVSLVNSALRIVLTNDPGRLTGDVIAEVGEAGDQFSERLDSREFPFALVRTRR